MQLVAKVKMARLESRKRVYLVSYAFSNGFGSIEYSLVPGHLKKSTVREIQEQISKENKKLCVIIAIVPLEG